MPWICRKARELYRGEYQLFPGRVGKNHAFPNLIPISLSPLAKAPSIYLSVKTDIFCFPHMGNVFYNQPPRRPGYDPPILCSSTIYLHIQSMAFFFCYASPKTKHRLLNVLAQKDLETVMIGQPGMTPTKVGEFTNFVEMKDGKIVKQVLFGNSPSQDTRKTRPDNSRRTVPEIKYGRFVIEANTTSDTVQE
jgi:hypothetical protein